MSEIVKQSGFWVLVFILSCSLIKLFGSLGLHREVLKLSEFIKNLTSTRVLEKDEKILLENVLSQEDSKYLWVIAPFSFFFFIAAIFMGIVSCRELKDDNCSYNKQVLKAEKRHNFLLAGIIEDETGVSPLETVIWKDGTYQYLTDMVFNLYFLKSPILSLLILVNAIFSVPFLLLAVFLSVPMNKIIDYLWWPLKIQLIPIRDKYFKLFT